MEWQWRVDYVPANRAEWLHIRTQLERERFLVAKTAGAWGKKGGEEKEGKGVEEDLGRGEEVDEKALGKWVPFFQLPVRFMNPWLTIS